MSIIIFIKKFITSQFYHMQRHAQFFLSQNGQ